MLFMLMTVHIMLQCEFDQSVGRCRAEFHQFSSEPQVALIVAGCLQPAQMRNAISAILLFFAGMLPVGAVDTAAAASGESLHYWPQWRGPLANGVAPHANPPLSWSESKNLRWKIPLPGKG